MFFNTSSIALPPALDDDDDDDDGDDDDVKVRESLNFLPSDLVSFSFRISLFKASIFWEDDTLMLSTWSFNRFTSSSCCLCCLNNFNSKVDI